MPEGHTLRRLAIDLGRLLAGERLTVTSPQGPFAADARLVDGHVLRRAEAYGKHLLLVMDDGLRVHVHLGLYGRLTHAPGPPPPVRGQVRMRLVADSGWADLRGAATCEVLDAVGAAALLTRLGPDPLRPGSEPDRAWARISRSTVPLAALLMQQDVLAGVGNVFRAEVLFRAGLDPYLPGRQVPRETFDVVWDDLVALMRQAVRANRIVTTAPEDRARRRGPARPEDSHYVYGRTGLPCRRCGTPVVQALLAGRVLYWCPADQA